MKGTASYHLLCIDHWRRGLIDNALLAASHNGTCISSCPRHGGRRGEGDGWGEGGGVWRRGTGKQMARSIVPVTHLPTRSIRLLLQVSAVVYACVCVHALVCVYVCVQTRPRLPYRTFDRVLPLTTGEWWGGHEIELKDCWYFLLFFFKQVV